MRHLQGLGAGVLKARHHGRTLDMSRSSDARAIGKARPIALIEYFAAPR